MSISDLILFPHVPIEIYNQYRETNRISVNNLKSIVSELDKLFKNSQGGDKLAELILFDFYLSINHRSVFKDNITGKILEQRLSQLFALSTGDSIIKTNPDIKYLMDSRYLELFDKDTLDLVCSNYREKGDLFFYRPASLEVYKMSIKSLVPSNDEINFGAFEFASTIRNIEGLEMIYNIQERNRTIDVVCDGEHFKGIGLGSNSQLKSMLNYIKYKNKFEEYRRNFEILLSSVYKDDFLVYIKDNNKFRVHLIDNSSFINFIMDKLDSDFKNTRVEGNAIRVSGVTSFIKYAAYSIEIDFNNSIPHFNEIESMLINLSHEKSIAIRKFISAS